MYIYEKNGSTIYHQSFDIIRTETDLSRFSDAESQVVIRMIHACGMIDLADDVVISPGAVEAGHAALAAGSAIVCDVTMVQQGINRRNLPHDNPVFCNVNDDKGKACAKAYSTTRSAGGIGSLESAINYGIVVIGNAPTALFHLLEMIDRLVEPPALVVGCPVGFVGAVESKEALIAHQANVPFITVRGRRGGSGIAAGVVNAIAAGLNA